MKLPWTRTERWLWFAPILVGVGAFALTWGPKLARKAMGYPTKLEVPGLKNLYYIALSNDGSTLVASGIDGRRNRSGIAIWDARTLQLKTVWPANMFPMVTRRWDVSSALAVSPDGSLLTCLTSTVPFTAFNLNTRKKLWSFGQPGFIAEAHFSNDGRLVGFTEGAKGGVKYVVLNSADGKLHSSWQSALYSDEVCFNFSRDGTLVVSVGSRLPAPTDAPYEKSNGRNIEIHRVADGKLLRTITSIRTSSVAFSPDGAQVVAIAEPLPMKGIEHQGNRTFCFSASTGQPLWSVGAPRGDSSCTAVFSPDGSQVAIYQITPARIALVNARTGALERTLHVDGEASLAINPSALAFSPDGKRLFARGKDGVLVWDLD